MLGDQFILADLRVALILALEGAAVGEIMFGGRRDMRGPDRPPSHERPLQPQHPRARIIGNEPRIGRIAFIAASPAQILRHRERRRSEEHTSELQTLMSISYAVF